MVTSVKKLAVDGLCILYFIYEFCFFWIFLGQAIIPGLYASGFKKLLQRHIERNGDFLMYERPNWFRFSLWLELTVGIPLLILFLWGFAKKKTWVKVICGCFCASLSSVTLLIEGEYWLSESLSTSQKVSLTFLYLPRLLTPLLISVYIFTSNRFSKFWNNVPSKREIESMEKLKLARAPSMVPLSRSPSKHGLDKFRSPSTATLKRTTSVVSPSRKMEKTDSVPQPVIAFQKEAKPVVTTTNIGETQVPPGKADFLPPLKKSQSTQSTIVKFIYSLIQKYLI